MSMRSLAIGLILSATTGAAQAAALNLSPFGASSIVGGAFANGTTIINPQGGNDANTGTFFHTDNTTAGRGWTVDLPDVTDLLRVEVVNRADGSAPERLTGAVLSVLDAADAVIASMTLSGSYGVGEVVTFDNSGLGFADAAKVRITHSSNYLHAAEVRAVANSITTAKPTTGQAYSGSYPTANGNDGNFATFSHGNDNTTDFWQVDLQGVYRVDWASILGRAGFASRTNGATLSLLGPDGKTVIASQTISGLSNSGAGYGSFSMTDGYDGVSYIKVQGVNFLHVGELAAVGQTFGPAQNVTLQNATATFSQNASPHFLLVGETIDGITSGSTNGWGNATPAGDTNDNNAVWETASDAAVSVNSILKFTMTFNSFADHGLGRFRLWATTADRSEFADGLPSGGDVDFTGADTGSWILLDELIGFSATSGLQLAGGTLQGDGSFLIDDTATPGSDTYTIHLMSPLQNITGFRLEILNDASLTGGGPGLANTNGNSVLTEFAVEVLAIPTPAALPAGLGLMTLGAMRRRRK